MLFNTGSAAARPLFLVEKLTDAAVSWNNENIHLYLHIYPGEKSLRAIIFRPGLKQTVWLFAAGLSFLTDYENSMVLKKERRACLSAFALDGNLLSILLWRWRQILGNGFPLFFYSYAKYSCDPTLFYYFIDYKDHKKLLVQSNSARRQMAHGNFPMDQKSSNKKLQRGDIK